ncbi:MAG: acetate--CoA ligase family protein [Deltaproteobacteria bacterium]|nr:acetate--CoA ligase family protein [Deltaproteobacteria bacterium]MBW2051256.1 acetate--CoA ligase family protein [Deltaproteobacteria bacterium]MBW2323559.1 acetate--CoA ligase family protein [Deltaproteobacteria bacterium]
MKIIEEALKRGAKTLSEYESKLLLAEYGINVTQEKVVSTEDDAAAAASEIGYPVVLKGSGEELTHKTELDLIALNLRDENDVREAFKKLTSTPEANVKEVLVQQMVKGDRELVVGLTRDAQFGPCVMFGLGGIFTEILEDVSFRVAPLTRWDAMDMMEDFRAKKILDAFRGQPPVDREVLADILIAVGKIGMEQEKVQEIDINPMKVLDGKPVAVDALVVLNND